MNELHVTLIGRSSLALQRGAAHCRIKTAR